MFRGVGVRGRSGIGEGGGGFSLPGCFLKVMVLLSRLGLFIYSLTKGHHFRVLCQKKKTLRMLPYPHTRVDTSYVVCLSAGLATAPSDIF